MTELQKISKSDEVMFPTTLKGMKLQAKEILDSGICPKDIKTIAQVLVIGLSGREYGLPMMESLRSLYPINGRVTMSADLMVGLAMRHDHWIQVIEATPEKAVIDFFRKERPNEPYRHTFTMAEAKTAGAGGKDTYKKWPKLMCLAGCKREGCRIMYADILHNTITPEEAGLIEDNQGNIITINQFDEQVEIDEVKKEIQDYVDNPDLASAFFQDWCKESEHGENPEMTLSMVKTFQQYVFVRMANINAGETNAESEIGKSKEPGAKPVDPEAEKLKRDNPEDKGADDEGDYNEFLPVQGDDKS